MICDLEELEGGRDVTVTCRCDGFKHRVDVHCSRDGGRDGFRDVLHLFAKIKAPSDC
jgi:hypothetical protein